MTEIPPYLFLVTSTALVLGAAITIRGLLGFRPLATETVAGLATTPDTSDTSDTTDTSAVATATSAVSTATSAVSTATATATGPTDTASTAPPAHQVRDLREPIVMTIAGVLICTFTLLAIAALINSA